MGRFLEAVFVFGVVAMVTTASGQDSPGIHGDNEQSPPADACYKVENMGTTSEQLDAGSGPDIRNVPHGAAPAREKTKRMPFRYDPMVTKNVPHGAAPAPEKTKRMPFRYDPMVTENVPHGAAPAPEKTKRMPFRYDPMVTELLPVTTRRRLDEDENSKDAGRKLVESLKTAKQDSGRFPTQLGYFLCCVRKLCTCNST
ncbi:uncharacterized protein [Ambystoma mexicanum]|uniref:uncharacterized protein isoform X2 n=1 Tax=Ambystoma mexicanum TaxID=8296 RepID=UPI0037E7D5EE